MKINLNKIAKVASEGDEKFNANFRSVQAESAVLLISKSLEKLESIKEGVPEAANLIENLEKCHDNLSELVRELKIKALEISPHG